MIGYLEGLGSERRIAWSCNDSIALRTFLGYGITQSTSDHSTLSKTRKRLSAEVHKQVFNWLLKLLREAGLLRGRTLGVDSTTVEANAAMRSIVRRDDERGYEEYLEDLAKESGIETPTKEDLARIDKQRKNKASNRKWVHKGDPEARVAGWPDPIGAQV